MRKTLTICALATLLVACAEEYKPDVAEANEPRGIQNREYRQSAAEPETHELEFTIREGDSSFDPLYVQNTDVVDPERREYVKGLKSEWATQALWRLVEEARAFRRAGDMEAYEAVLERINERLSKNTRFRIVEITENGMTLEGDTGARVRMELNPPPTYGD